MSGYVLTPAAQADLEDIWHFLISAHPRESGDPEFWPIHLVHRPGTGYPAQPAE